MQLCTREANQEDYEELCEVIAEVDALHCEAVPHVYRPPDGPARSKDYIASVIADDNAALFVAQSDGEIVGLIQILVREAPEIPIMVPRRYAVINTLAVKRGFRRLGVGRALIERAHRWAQEKGATQGELSVWEFNGGAIAFYEKLGYRTASRRMWRALRRDRAERGRKI